MDSIAAHIPAEGLPAHQQTAPGDMQVAGHLFNLSDFDNLFPDSSTNEAGIGAGTQQNFQNNSSSVSARMAVPVTGQGALEQQQDTTSESHKLQEIFRKSRRLLKKSAGNDKDDISAQSTRPAKSPKLCGGSSPGILSTTASAVSISSIAAQPVIGAHVSQLLASGSLGPPIGAQVQIQTQVTDNSPEAARLREEERVRLRNRNQARRARQRRRQAVVDMEKKLQLLEHENQVLKNAFRTLHMQHTLTEALVVSQCGQNGQSVVQQMRALTQAKQCSLSGLATDLLVPPASTAGVTPILPQSVAPALLSTLLKQTLPTPKATDTGK